MKEKTNNHGGARPNSGRPANDRKAPLMVRISQEAMDKLNRLTKNKAQFIDEMIKQQPE